MPGGLPGGGGGMLKLQFDRYITRCQQVWSSISVKIKVSFYYAVLLFYVVVYAFTDVAFAMFVAHFSLKDVKIS